MSNILVSVFSATGTTLKVAEKIAQATGGTLFQIEPTVPYTSADLNWNSKGSRANQENADSSARPPIKTTVPDFSKYDVIFIGFPIWWYTMPKIIYTFLESYDFSGKTIIPFATSGGSGLQKAVPAIKAVCPNAKVLDGKTLNNNPSQSTIDSWVHSLGL